MDELTLLHRVVTETSRVVENVSGPQMANASPCEGWSVRDVVNHITGGATMFAFSAEQGSVPDEVLGRLMGGDNLGDDAQGAWAAASATGQTIDDEDLVETALVMGRQMVGPELRQPGVFDPEQPVAADAPATTRLLAFAGRQV